MSVRNDAMEAGDSTFVRSAYPRLIALAGRAGSGKSTVAEYLAAQFGYKRTRFAAPLKNMLRSLYATAGLHPDEVERRIEGDLKETPDPLLCGRTPRHAMQTLGTEWRDLIGRELWTDLWRASVASGLCVVEDCRFDHECTAVRQMGGIVVLVDRSSPDRQSSGHVSEQGLAEAPDCIIDNNGTLIDLRVAVGRVLYVHEAHSNGEVSWA